MKGPTVKKLRIASSAGLLFFIPVGLQQGFGQLPGDVTAGRQLAAAICMDCHRITASDRNAARMPPDFGAIADTPAMTPLSLRVFLQTPHGQMPRYQFTSAELDDIVAYVSSLSAR